MPSSRLPLLVFLALVLAPRVRGEVLELFETRGTVLVNDQPVSGRVVLAAGSRLAVAPGSCALIGIRPSLRVVVSGLASPQTPAGVSLAAIPEAAGQPLQIALTAGEVAYLVDGEPGQVPPLAVDVGGVIFRFDSGSGFVERSAARTALGIRDGAAVREAQGAAAAPLPAGKTVVWPAGKPAAVTEFTPASTPCKEWLDPERPLPRPPPPATPWCGVLAAWHDSGPAALLKRWAWQLGTLVIAVVGFLLIASPPAQPAILGLAILLAEARWDLGHIWWVGVVHLPVGAFVLGGLLVLWIWRARGPWPDGRPPAAQLAQDLAWRLGLCLLPTLLPVASADKFGEICSKWGGFLGENKVAWKPFTIFYTMPAERISDRPLFWEMFALMFLPVLITSITRPRLTGNECRFCGRGKGKHDVDHPLWRNQVDPLRRSLPFAKLEEVLNPVLAGPPLARGQTSPYVLSVTYQLCWSCYIGEVELRLRVGAEPPVERSIMVRGRSQFELLRKL